MPSNKNKTSRVQGASQKKSSPFPPDHTSPQIPKNQNHVRSRQAALRK
jgi:hypothetical protein